MKTLFFLLTVCTIFCSFSVYASYVRSHEAPLYETPGYRSKKILALSRGEVVQELEKRGCWIKVRVNGRVGWIMRMYLSNNLYSNKIAMRRERQAKLNRGKRRRNIRTRVSRVAVGVKGLRASQVAKMRENQTDFDALEKMEKVAVSEETAIRFVMDYREL